MDIWISCRQIISFALGHVALLLKACRPQVSAGHSPLGAPCNITLQRSYERGLFSHGHSPLGALGNVTPNPFYRVTTWDVATRYKNDTAPYKELS